MAHRWFNQQAIQATQQGTHWLRSAWATPILAAISFAESFFLPVLIDPFLIALVLANRSRWLYYTTVSIVASVIGGVAAYFVGLWFFDIIAQPLITTYGWQDDFTRISARVDASGFAFVLIGAVTPIPYKIVAIASGFGQISFLTFLVASVFGRIIRLGLVGYVAYAVGPHALPVFRRHFRTIAYVFLAVLVVYVLYRVWFS